MRKIFTAENLICLAVFLLPIYIIRFQILGVPTNVLELLMLLAVFACFSQPASRQLAKKYVRTYVRGYVLPTSLILAGLLLSIAANENYRGGLGILKGWFILPILFALAIIVAAKDESVKEKILQALYFSTFGVSLIALFYFCADKLTYDGRLAAFYLSPNYLAMFLAPGIIIATVYIENFKFKILNLKLLFFTVSFLIILIAFYFTYSYAAWISVIISIAIVNIIKKFSAKNFLLVVGCWLLVVFIIISLVALSQWPNPKFQNIFTFDERSSLASRIMIWKSSLKILEDNMLFGIGPGNFQNKYLKYQKYFPPYLEWAVPQPHNLYLAFWLQGGILGLLGFFCLTGLWIKEILSVIRQKKNAFLSLETALLGIIFYILLHGLVDTTYWKNDLAVIFWVALALGINQARKP